MQARTHPARAGHRWIAEGWRLFRQQPFGFAMLLFTFMTGILIAHLMVQGVAMILARLIPGVAPQYIAEAGGMLIAVLVPGLTVGFLEGCRAVRARQPLQPQMMVKAFASDADTRRNLLVLGLVYSIGMRIVLSIAMGADLPMPPPGSDAPAGGAGGAVGAGGGAPAPVALPPEAGNILLMHVLVALAAYVPIAMVLWYAPVLVAWHRIGAGKAMFFSLAACWRNRAAFVVYALSWFAIVMALSLLGGALRIGGLGDASVVLLMPLMFVIVLTMYCSVYPSYHDVFSEIDTQA